MQFRLILAALAVLSAWPVAAAPDGVIRGSMAVCDPNNPTNCLAPNASGGLPSSGGGTSGGPAYGPTAIGSAPNQPPLFLGYTDAGGLMRGVTPLLELPVHDYDLRASSVTLSAAAGSFLDIPLNGDGTVGLTFKGLAASGATVSFFESNDATIAPASPINALNASTGVSSPTRNTDGDTRIAVAGHTTLRVQVTTAGTGNIALSYNVSEIAGIVDVRSPLPPGSNTIGGVVQPDARAIAQTLAAGTANAAVTVPLVNAEGVVGWTVTGLTASGATLTAEGSNDGGTTWGAINTVSPGSGALSSTITADGNYRVNAGGHTNVRLRVSTAGTGSISVSYNASSVAPLVGLSAPLPVGSNTVGAVNQGTPNSTANAWPTTDTNTAQTIAAPGTAAPKAQAVQGPAGGALATAASQPTVVQSGQTYQATQTGNLSFGSVSTSEPTYGSGQDYPPSLTPWGGLRTSSAEAGSAQASVGIVPDGGAGSTCAAGTATTGCIAKNAGGNLYSAYATSPTAPTAQLYLIAINATAVPASGAAITAADWGAFSSASAAGATGSINYGAGPPDTYSAGIVLLVSTSLTTYSPPGAGALVNARVR